MKWLIGLMVALAVAAALSGCANQSAAVNLTKGQADLVAFGANMKTSHAADEAQRGELEGRLLDIEIKQKAQAGAGVVEVATGALMRKAQYDAERARREAAFQGTFKDYAHGLAYVQSVLLYHQTGVDVSKIDVDAIGALITGALAEYRKPDPLPVPATQAPTAATVPTAKKPLG